MFKSLTERLEARDKTIAGMQAHLAKHNDMLDAKNATDAEKVETEGTIAEHKESQAEEQLPLDQAIQEITELQPECGDMTMSYDERVAKQEPEIKPFADELSKADRITNITEKLALSTVPRGKAQPPDMMNIQVAYHNGS